ncbi:MAG: MMPL family transporter, partial [Solirubrobacteraceae bacterium]|nr:MMPL family transporter [Patulibacter sp.]
MSALLARIARALSRRWGFGLLGVVVTFGVLGALAANGGPAAEDFSIPGTETQKVQDLLKAHNPNLAGVDSQVVFYAKSGTVSDPANKATIEATMAKIAKQPHVVAAPSPLAAGAQSISKDGRIASTTVQYDLKSTDITQDEGTAFIDAVKTGNSSTLQASARGQVAEIAAQQSGDAGELVGLLIAAILLWVLFRSAVAMLVTLFSAIIGVAFGETLLLAVSQSLGLPEFATFLAALLGLGAGIDYSLLIIGRFREQSAAGFSVRDAAAKASATTGAAVLTAGLIVVVAIAGLLAIGIPLIGKMGVGAGVGILGVVISALTVLPVLIGAFSRWMRPKKAVHVQASPGFTRWGEIVTAKPLVSIGAGVLVLVLLALPATHMRLGQPDDSNKPKDDTQRIAYDHLSQAFGAGSNGPFLFAVDVPKGDP